MRRTCSATDLNRLRKAAVGDEVAATAVRAV